MRCSFDKKKKKKKGTKSKRRKPSEIRVDKGGEFYNKSMNSWLHETDIEMHLTHNKGKCVVAERLIRALKNKIYKIMTLFEKCVYL